MLGLPESTEFNRTIPKKTLYTRAILTDSMRSIYESQATRIIWRNKLSNATYPLCSDAATGSELELFEIQTRGKSWISVYFAVLTATFRTTSFMLSTTVICARRGLQRNALQGSQCA